MTYYAAAVAAMLLGEDGQAILRLHAMVVHPEADTVDAARKIAVDAARVEAMPESEGWSHHYAVVQPIDRAISVICEAEKAAIPGELRIVQIPVEAM